MGHNNNQRGTQPQSQEQKNKGQQKKDNWLKAKFRIAWRFYSTVLNETFHALILTSPVLFYMWWTGIKIITVKVNAWELVGIVIVMGMLESSMYKKGGN